MKAMLFAAGLGTRLRPLTNTIPKALVEVNGVTLLERNIQRLLEAGYTELVLNVHYFPEQILSFLESKNNFGINIRISDESEELLETGGGLKKARKFLAGTDAFIVANVDVLSTINLHKFRKAHESNGGLATLAVRNRETSRYLLFDDSNKLVGWKNEKTNEYKWVNEKVESYRKFAFSGIQMLGPMIFELFTHEGKFSIIDSYLSMAKDHSIYAYLHDTDIWIDVGRADSLLEAERVFV